MPMRERAVYVGLKKPRKRDDIEILFAGSNVNFHLRTESVTAKLRTTIPDRLLDFLEIAAAVYAADSLTSRGGPARKRWGEDWRRRFEFTVAVRDPTFWRSDGRAEALARAVDFLSEDTATFTFIPGTAAPPATRYFDFEPHADGAFIADDVVLLSGGLDSLAGAVELLETTTHNVVFVTHLSAPKVESRQTKLVYQLLERYPGRTFWLPIKATLAKQKAAETTQRSRTLLFAAMGFVAAQMFGAKRLLLFENGVVSLNLPISKQVVGALATRTTHPQSIALLRDLLERIADPPVVFENPYFWRTKTEVVETIERHGEGDLIQLAFSCSQVRSATLQHPHCGRCSQCIDRRFAILAAGADQHEEPTTYEVDLLLGERPDDRDRTMVTDYVRRAQACQSMPDRQFFVDYASELSQALEGYPDRTRLDVARDALALHRRHGEAVNSVLDRAVKTHSAELIAGSFPPTSLLPLVIGGGRPQAPANLDEVRDEARAAAQWPATDQLIQIELRRGQSVWVVGLCNLGIPAAQLITALKCQYDADLQAERDVAEYAYMRSTTLAERAGARRDDAWVRQTVMQIRKAVAEAYEAINGYPPSDDLIIQNRRRSGYRLNPAVRFVNPSAA